MRVSETTCSRISYAVLMFRDPSIASLKSEQMQVQSLQRVARVGFGILFSVDSEDC